MFPKMGKDSRLKHGKLYSEDKPYSTILTVYRCNCPDWTHDYAEYKCYYCREWFCVHCAENHFKEHKFKRKLFLLYCALGVLIFLIKVILNP